jgi:hypothetical protein
MKGSKSVASKLTIAIFAAALMVGVLATAAQAAAKHYDGTVISKNSTAKTFRITTQGGSKLTLKVNGNTVFERITGGFGGLKSGLAIQVNAVQTKAGLVAKKVEPQGGGGSGGGSDDGPNHT